MFNPNNMVEFGAGPTGEMISGKWINKKTGQVINVRDSFIDEMSNMVINTDKGTLSMEEFSKYYIQASDEVYDQSGKVIDNKPVDNAELGIEGGVSFAGNDNPLVADPIYNTSKVTNNEPILKNFDLIDKIFKKTDSKPSVELKIKWDNFPNKELSMLVKIFDVTTEEIAQYINKYLVNSDLLNESLDKWLKENLI